MKPIPPLAKSSGLTPENRSAPAPGAPTEDRTRPQSRRQQKRQNYKFVAPSRWIIDPDFDVDRGAG
jgi:hypothetical protein